MKAIEGYFYDVFLHFFLSVLVGISAISSSDSSMHFNRAIFTKFHSYLEMRMRLYIGVIYHCIDGILLASSKFGRQPRPRGFSLKIWVGQEKALASAGHVQSLNIPEKLIYMQHSGFALTEESNNGK